MTIFHHYLVTGITICGFLLNTTAGYAQPESTTAPANPPAKKMSPAEAVAKLNAADPWISNGPGLGRWWRKSAKFLDPMPNPLLYHVEGMYSYADQGGNADLKSHKAQLSLNLRKGAATSVTTVTLNKLDNTKALTEKTMTSEDYFIREGLRYAVTDKFDVVVGASKERNTVKYFEDRTTYYVGLRSVPIDKPTLTLTLAAYYDIKQKMTFLNSEIWKVAKYADFPAVPDYESAAVDFFNQLDWKITDTIELTQSFSYVRFLDDNFFHWDLQFDLAVALTERTSIVTSYSFKYDENLFVKNLGEYLDDRTAKGKSSGKIEKLDTALMVGIKFSF